MTPAEPAVQTGDERPSSSVPTRWRGTTNLTSQAWTRPPLAASIPESKFWSYDRRLLHTVGGGRSEHVTSLVKQSLWVWRGKICQHPLAQRVSQSCPGRFVTCEPVIGL